MTPIAQRQRWEGCRPWAREPGAAEDGEVERNLVWASGRSSPLPPLMWDVQNNFLLC